MPPLVPYSVPYDDEFGNMTIGYGHVIKSGEKFSYLSKEAAKDLLKKDLQYWGYIVEEWMRLTCLCRVFMKGHMGDGNEN